MDAPPVFAALLDPETGGDFSVCPAVPYRAERRYVPGTCVLETTFTTDDGQVVVTDALNRDVAGLLAWLELAREVRAVQGQVPMRWRVAPAGGSAGSAHGRRIAIRRPCCGSGTRRSRSSRTAPENRGSRERR
jgi:Trehalase-like, N-terminal